MRVPREPRPFRIGLFSRLNKLLAGNDFGAYIAFERRPSAMTILQFGKVQMRMMRILWDKQRLTARELTDEMNRQAPIAHSTVQTLLRTLEDKQAVGHDVEGRTFYFYPLVPDSQVIERATRSFIENMFDGSPGRMVSFLVRNQYLSPGEMKQIADLISSAEPGEAPAAE
jgi:predicted transcriptional regulator